MTRSTALLGTTAGLGGAVVAAALGFAVRPRPFAPMTGEDRGVVELRQDLPPLLRQHLDADGDGHVPRMDTVGLWADTRMRVGRTPWLPLRYRSLLGVGAAFVTDIELTWWGRPVLTGVDAYVDDRGMTRIGRSANVGDEIDQGANLALWANSTLVPSAFAVGGRIAAVQEDFETTRLTFPLGSRTDVAWLRFSGGHPRRLSALRYKRTGRPKLWWHADYFGWRRVHGICLPQRLEVTWEDEGRPWLRMDLVDFAANIDIDAALTRAAQLVRRARSSCA